MKPPVAPVLAILSSASDFVVQVMLVPGLLTNGNAAQVRPAAALQSVKTKAPFTHCAKEPLTQATSPAVHEEEGVSLANFAFSACASFPFWSAKDSEELDPEVVPEDGAAVVVAEEVVTCVSTEAIVVAVEVEVAITVFDSPLLDPEDPELHYIDYI